MLAIPGPSQDTTGSEIYFSAYHYRHPALAYLARDFPHMRFIYQGGVLPAPGDAGALYIFPRSAPVPEEWRTSWAGHLVAAEPGPDGVPDFYAYRFGPGETIPLPDFGTAAANFANIVALQGLRPVSVTAGGPAVVDLLWQVLNPPEAGDLRFVADLVDRRGQHWTQAFNDAYPSEQWVAGDRLVAAVWVVIPSSCVKGSPVSGLTLSVEAML